MLVLIGLAPLAGCSSTPVATVKPVTIALRDVCVSRDDLLTESTAQAIEANNLALRKLKGKSTCPKPSRAAPPPAPMPKPSIMAEPKTS
ncbi:MAG: hypothetical protein ACRCS9_08720 [Hyphomicrobium sp.]